MKDKKMNKKDWLFGCIGCLGIIVILGIIFTLFMGYMSDLTDKQRDDKKQEEVQEKKEVKKKEKESAKKAEVKKEEKAKEETKEKEEPKNVDPEKELNDNIKKSVGKEHFKSIDYHDNTLVVNLQNYDGLSRKGMVKNGNNGIVKALKEIKKSDIKPQQITVNVMQDVTTGELKDIQANFIHSKWNPDVVNRLSKDNSSKVINDPEGFAEEYRVNENIK